MSKNKSLAEKSIPVEKGADLKTMTITTAELAETVGVSVSWIKQLQQKEVIKPLPNQGNRKAGNRWQLQETLSAFFRYYQNLVDSRNSKDSDDTVKTKNELLKIKLKRESLELAQFEGELHKAEDIERVMGAVLTRLRINLLAIPMGIAPQLREQKDVNLIAEKINERICRALNEVVDIDLDKLIAEEFGDYYSGEEVSPQEPA